MTVDFFGYQFGAAGSDGSTAMGPIVVKDSNFNSQLDFAFRWHPMINCAAAGTKQQALTATQQCCHQLQQHIASTQSQFVVIGGDHSSAIGTIQGAQQKFSGDLKLLWIDAHMDSHTFSTSESQNIHGMPIAVVLGQAEAPLGNLCQPHLQLKPENICMLGIRSYEPPEKKLLQQLGVKIIDMNTILELGIEHCLAMAIEYLRPSSANELLLSIDLDAFNPADAPAVTVPEANGIDAQDFIAALATQQQLFSPFLSGVEIVEFSPQNDIDQKTEALIFQLLKQIFVNSSKTVKAKNFAAKTKHQQQAL